MGHYTRKSLRVNRVCRDSPNHQYPARGRKPRIALQELGVPILNAFTSQRIAYAQASSNGRTVVDTEPAGPAANEVRALVQDIKELDHASG